MHQNGVVAFLFLPLRGLRVLRGACSQVQVSKLDLNNFQSF